MDYYQIGQRVRKYRKRGSHILPRGVAPPSPYEPHRAGHTKRACPSWWSWLVPCVILRPAVRMAAAQPRPGRLPMQTLHFPAAANHADIVNAAKISHKTSTDRRHTKALRFARTQKTPEVHTSGVSFVRSRHLPIFTGRVQPTIFGTSELNFCVRNGNRWGLTVIDTGRPEYINQLALLSSRTSLYFVLEGRAFRTE